MNTPRPIKQGDAIEGGLFVAVLAEARSVICEELGHASRESVHAGMLQALVAQYRWKNFNANLRPHAARVLRALADYVEAEDADSAAEEVAVSMRAYMAQLQANDVGADNTN